MKHLHFCWVMSKVNVLNNDRIVIRCQTLLAPPGQIQEVTL